MHDLPLMDRADVSLAVDGDRQLLPSSRRDSEEKTRARVCRVKNIFHPPDMLARSPGNP